MVRFKHNKENFFFAPPNDPTGGTGNPGAGQGGHQAPVAGASAVDDPFAGVDPDDLPPEVKAKWLEAKGKFATLQTSQQQTATQLEASARQARDFQSRHDKLQADLQKLQGGRQNDPQQSQEQIYLAQVEQTLIQSGVSPEQAKIHAPVHAKLLLQSEDRIKREIGAGLQPMVQATLSREAESSWQQVKLNDRLGALNVPEVAQAVWDGVGHLVQQGQQVSPEVVANLKHMHYSAYLEAGGTPPAQFQPGQPTLQQPPMQQQQQQQQPQYPNTATRFTFPGAGNQAFQPQVADPNAARTSLNTETHNALAATFARMGTSHIPKGLQQKR